MQGDPNDVFSGIVAYDFANIPAGTTERTQIVTAISRWNSALAGGCSFIHFVPGPGGDEASFLSIENGTIGSGAAAHFFMYVSRKSATNG